MMSKNHTSFIRTGILLLTLTFALCLYGCASGKSVYDTFKEIELTDEELELLSEGKLTYEGEYGKADFGSTKEYLEYKAYQFITGGHGFLKEKAPLYIVISWVIGLVMFSLARKSITVRKLALFVFGIGIPGLLFLLVYGSAFLADHMK